MSPSLSASAAAMPIEAWAIDRRLNANPRMAACSESPNSLRINRLSPIMIRRHVVGHIGFQAGMMIQISDHQGESTALFVRPKPAGCVRKRSIAIAGPNPVRFGIKGHRIAGSGFTDRWYDALVGQWSLTTAVTDFVDVGVSIVIQVGDRDRSGPSGSIEIALLGDITKRPISVVSIQTILRQC